MSKYLKKNLSNQIQDAESGVRAVCPAICSGICDQNGCLCKKGVPKANEDAAYHSHVNTMGYMW